MKKHNGKKIITALIILLILAAVIFCLFRFMNNGKKEYITDTVQISDISSSITIKGTVRGRDERKVYSDSPNKVLNISVKKGDTVKKGQTLATLDIEKLKMQYDIAYTDYESAKRNYDNMTVLSESGSVPDVSLKEAKSALDKAELLCRSYDIENAGKIISPIDGVVTEINCSEGGYASISVLQQPAFVIEDQSGYILKAEAKEKYMTSIYVGQDAEITSEAMGNMTATGKVTEIAPSGKTDPKTGSVVVPVTVGFNALQGKWMTGISGKAKLVLTAKDTLTVPLDAVSENSDETCVYVLNKDKSFRKVAIETGINDGIRIQVVSGELEKDDTVIMNPDTYLQGDDKP